LGVDAANIRALQWFVSNACEIEDILGSASTPDILNVKSTSHDCLSVALKTNKRPPGQHSWHHIWSHWAPLVIHQMKSASPPNQDVENQEHKCINLLPRVPFALQ